MFDKHYIGRDVVGAENNGLYKPVSRVTLMLDNENALTAGDDTGLEIVADCHTLHREWSTVCWIR